MLSLGVLLIQQCIRPPSPHELRFVARARPRRTRGLGAVQLLLQIAPQVLFDICVVQRVPGLPGIVTEEFVEEDSKGDDGGEAPEAGGEER